jgi:hypothetical protein
MLTTCLFWALLTLLLLNGVALVRPASPLARCSGSLLMLALVVLASLPTPGWPLRPLLLLGTTVVGIALVRAMAKAEPTDAANGRHALITALLVSLTTGLLFALRPHPFEYPGDSVDYLNNFQRLTLEGARDASCLEGTWRLTTYWSGCTFWTALLQASPLDLPSLLGGVPQRVAIGLQIAILAMTVFRCLRYAGVRPATASLYWLLIVFGLGNQSISFLVNHGLQGSILAAAVFLEAVMVTLWILEQRGPAWIQAALLPLCLAPLLYLELKLHGAFALLTLALLVPLAPLLGLRSLMAQPRHRWLNRRSGLLLLAGGMALLALLLAFKAGWAVDAAKTPRLLVRWTFLRGLGITDANLPASSVLRSPASRPEVLAVVSLLASGWCLMRPQPVKDSAGNGAGLYREVASLYNLGILAAFLLPPFSHLYLNLPYEIISSYRLMWGQILFSPLPILIQNGVIAPARPRWTLPRGLKASLVGLLLILVLIPIPSGSRRYPQLFWSKSRHLLNGPSGRVDLHSISKALMPSILEGRGAGGEAAVVLADEVIGTALQGYPGLVKPVDATRIYNRSDPEQGLIHPELRKLSGTPLATRLTRLHPHPDLIIQETPIGSYYSPYEEIGVYDKDIGDHLSRGGVNGIPEQILTQLGYHRWRTLSEQGRILNPNDSSATYRLWRR